MIPLDTLNESELLKKFRNNDEAAFDYIYQIYSIQIYRKILKMTKVEVIALELLQDVFVRVWEKKHLIDPDQSFKSYLYRIAENIVIDFYRKVSREIKLQNELRKHQSNAYNHIEEGIYLKETESYLNQAISQLPAKQKSVFILCKMEGKSYQEASSMLGISISTVNGHIVNATKFIKGFLFKNEPLLIYIIISFTYQF